jgi:hypothetical protein
VAYEAQLKSDRAELHRRVAAAIESREPAAAEENAALIAEHLEAAGDGHAAYGWHMRAATWATNRDIGAARLSWERARKIADALPAEDPNRPAMRIAPRTMLWGTAFRVVQHVSADPFEEFRELCDAAGDKASLAIGMAGLVIDLANQDRLREASQLASETVDVAESVGDPNLTVGLFLPVVYAMLESSDWTEMLRWSQRVINLADGDPSKGNFLFGCPLALALSVRGMSLYFLGRSGWRADIRHGLAMARSADPLSYVTVVAYADSVAIATGVLRSDDRAIAESQDALRIAERSGDDLAVAFTWLTLGIALVHRETDGELDRGRELLAQASEVFVRRGHNLADVAIVKVYLGWERARRGDRDEAIQLMRAAVDHMVRQGQLLQWGIPSTGRLVQILLDRGTDDDLREAEAAIERLASAPATERLAMRDIWVLRSRALLARAHGEGASYVGLVNRYRDLATSLGFEGHIDWAEAMP